MIIEKIEIESYAAQKNVTLELTDGINLIEGSNESGKSSIADFIKFILYGVSGKSSEPHLSERKRAINFHDSHAGGSMTVKAGGKRYRISRNTAVSGTVRESARTKVSVVDLDSGKDIYDGTEPGLLLLGIDENVFSASAYLRQGAEHGIRGNDINEAVSNILLSGDERICADKAVERIENARIPLSHKHGNVGRIHDIKGEIVALSAKLMQEMGTNEQIIATEAAIEERSRTNREHIANYEALEIRKKAHENAKLLRDFEALSGAEKEKVDAEMKLLEFRAQAHIPTDDEMDELRAYERSISTLCAKLSECTAERARVELEKEQLRSTLKIKDAVESDGDEHTLADRAETRFCAARRFMLGTVVSLLTGVIFAAASFFVPSLFVLCMAAASVLGVLCLAFLFLSVSNQSKAKKICALADCNDVESLRAAIELYTASKERMHELEAHSREVDERTSECEELVRGEKQRLHEFLLDMDIDDCSELVSSMPKITDTLLCRTRKAAELEAAESAKRAYYEGLLSKTENIDADKIRAELEASGVKDPLSFDGAKLSANIKFYKDQSRLLTEKIHELEIKLTEMKASVSSPSQLHERISALQTELADCERKYSAYVLAVDSIKSAAQELRRSIAPMLARRACGYMDILTGSKYTELAVDDSFAITYKADGEQRHIDYMSKGTQELAYLSLRLSLADVISKEGALPVILDEVTAHLDDSRAKNLIALLSRRSQDVHQYVLFTCHSREAHLLADSGEEYNFIKL